MWDYTDSRTATTVQLTAIVDTELYSTEPNTNWGGDPDFWTQGIDIDRPLVKFDLSGIPSVATVTSASLRLVKTGGTAAALNVLAYRITTDWTEGTCVGGCTGVASWNQRQAGINWATPGGDFDPAVIATTSVGSANGNYTWDLTTLAQAWVDGAANYGVLLKHANETTAENKIFVSKEGTAANRPQLIVNYTLPEGFSNVDLPAQKDTYITAVGGVGSTNNYGVSPSAGLANTTGARRLSAGRSTNSISHPFRQAARSAQPR